MLSVHGIRRGYIRIKSRDMSYKLTYIIGKKVVQEWTLTNRSLAYWMKSELLNKGGYELGKFKVTSI
jgi:hypothetical protein